MKYMYSSKECDDVDDAYDDIWRLVIFEFLL